MLAGVLTFTLVTAILGLLIPGMRPHRRAARRFRDLARYRQPDEGSPWAVLALGALALAEILSALPAGASASSATLGALLGVGYAITTTVGWTSAAHLVLGGIGILATVIGFVEHVVAGGSGGVLGVVWRAGSFLFVLAAFVGGRATRPRKARPSLAGLTWFALLDTVAFLTAPGGVLPEETGPVVQIVLVTVSALAAVILGAIAPAMAIGLLAVGAMVANLSMAAVGLIPADDASVAVVMVICAVVTYFVTTVITSPLRSSSRR